MLTEEKQTVENNNNNLPTLIWNNALRRQDDTDFFYQDVALLGSFGFFDSFANVFQREEKKYRHRFGH